MILSDIFERFVQESPVSVMTQALLENALPPSTVDALFEDVAERQYTRDLLFSDVVNLMGTVVCRIRPSINAAYKKNADALGVTRKAVYKKIDRVELGISAALVRHTAGALGAVMTAMNGRGAPWLPGYRTRIVDGSHLPGTEHRLQPLRTTGAGALPGQAVVLFEPEAGLVVDVVLCEDGHAQERSLTEELLALVPAGDLWIADRNFCTTAFLFGIAARGGWFVIRQHGSTLTWEAVGPRRAQGRCDTGAVFEQTLRLTNDQGEILFVRRITVELDQPTRDGDRTIHIVTNLPEKDADAVTVARLYRQRWTLETAFQELQAALHGEINTLGYPKAALFAFCIALVSYNVLSTIKAAIRAVHGVAAAAAVSGSDLAEEVAGTHRGMMIAIPKDEWVVFHDLSPEQMSLFLQEMARAIRLNEYRKQPRGPKKPRPRRQSGAKIKHVATSKLLKNQKQ
jgi:Transposase DDE domain